MSISSFRREGVATYGPHTLEGNWYEERTRLACGEYVQLELMKGAVVAPLDPDLSIAPPTRVPGEASNGRLMIPDRMTRSRTTFNSSRQAADDGYRERTSMNQTFYAKIEDRVRVPISTEANYHGTWGGVIQYDGRSKTRVGPENREKNERFEAPRKQDGDDTIAKKMVNADNYHRLVTMGQPRPELNAATMRLAWTERPYPVEFGTILPRHKLGENARMLESTAMTSWR